jgi:hypothetical protein
MSREAKCKVKGIAFSIKIEPLPRQVQKASDYLRKIYPALYHETVRYINSGMAEDITKIEFRSQVHRIDFETIRDVVNHFVNVNRFNGYERKHKKANDRENDRTDSPKIIIWGSRKQGNGN